MSANLVSMAEISGSVQDGFVPRAHALPWHAWDRGLHEHVWELWALGLWHLPWFRTVVAKWHRLDSLSIQPLSFSITASPPFAEKGNLTCGFFLLLEGDTSVVVHTGDSGSSTLWTLNSLSFSLSSLTALPFAGPEHDAPHHCGHASLQQKEWNSEWPPSEKLQQG